MTNPPHAGKFAIKQFLTAYTTTTLLVSLIIAGSELYSHSMRPVAKLQSFLYRHANETFATPFLCLMFASMPICILSRTARQNWQFWMAAGFGVIALGLPFLL
jgi:hypothetical protein